MGLFAVALRLKQLATPANPPAGSTALYFKADGLLYKKDSSGTEKMIEGSGSLNSALLAYPVGSIYMSVSSTSPASLFGGTWAAWGTGRVPVAIDTTQTEFATVEQIGGEKTHLLTTAELPAHNHGIPHTHAILRSSVSGTSGTTVVRGGTSDVGSANTQDTNSANSDPKGSDQPHNNLQPYITCYMWKRTA